MLITRRYNRFYCQPKSNCPTKKERSYSARGAKDTDTHKNIVTAYIIVSNVLSLTQQHSAINWLKLVRNVFTAKETTPRATEDALSTRNYIIKDSLNLKSWTQTPTKCP